MPLLCLLLALFFTACTHDDGPPQGADLGAPMAGPPGLLEDCTPGPGEQPCAAGLRCGLVLSGDPPYQGWLTQCVPATGTLGEDVACAVTEVAPQQPGAQTKRYDRCAPGLGCVPTDESGLRCRTLCPLRINDTCGAGRLCVLPSPVSSLGYCARPDSCVAVPQGGCGRGMEGALLGCYVLTDEMSGGTFCLGRVALGDSTGALDSRCERSANCQPGLSCVNLGNGADPKCRPYCPLPALDGGAPDDGGAVRCVGDLGECHAIQGYETVGRCY